MFCGLPISVAADPMFAAHASASRNGSGCSPFLRHTSMSTGATARQTMSLLNTAESPATVKINAPSSIGGDRPEAADLDRHPGVEAAEPQLRRNDHEREQQDDGRQMDRLRRLVERELADREQRDGAEQRDPGRSSDRNGNPPRTMPR